jgi:hypothetical protein
MGAIKMKRNILLGAILLLLLFLFPAISVQAAEKTEFLSIGQWTQINLTLPQGFNLNWEFETYNNSFSALVRIDDLDGYYENLITAESGSGVYVAEKQGAYIITLLNAGSVGGYIRFTYNEPLPIISGYLPLLILGIIGLWILGSMKKLRHSKAKK